jgi:Nif-specific regulatory protein
MEPKLVVLAGPTMGTIVPVTDDEFSIGREKSCQLCLRSMLVSRQHCVLRRDSGQVKITDLESMNGTFVNSVPIKECVLSHGDQIRVGESVLQFFSREDEAVPTSPEEVFASKGVVVRSSVELSTQETFNLQAQREVVAQPPAGYMPRDLGTLVRFGATVSSIRGVEPLERVLLQSALEIAPAERGAVILAGNEPEEFQSAFSLERATGGKTMIRASREVVKRVLDEGVAILSNDIREDEGDDAAESAGSSGIKSILAVPLMISDRKLGVVHLESDKSDAAFDKRHLQLLTVMASIAAPALEAARHLEWLEGEYRRVIADIGSEHRLVGESRAMQGVREFIAKVAQGDSSILLCGESGTGKEVVARAIHANGSRARGPFVAINCAALTDTLLESELFGHERGAFTGAIAQKRGKLEVADGGTVFLDEIGAMRPASQAKLLRVLDDHKFERVGGTRPIKLNVRVIAATNTDLRQAIKTGEFREDLLYRLNVVSLTMPPLRARSEDVPLLANYFTARHSVNCKRRVIGISPAAHRCLRAYEWPGNVRELENAIERAVVLGSGEQIAPEDLPETVLETGADTSDSQTRYHLAVKELKRDLILKAVKEARGNYVRAAKSLGVHPKYLHRLARNLNLKDVPGEKEIPDGPE